MRNDKKTELKVGLTVFFGIILTLWIIGWAKNSFLYSEKKPLLVRFDSVAGLNVGDGVYINGLKKGLVTNINLDKNSIIVNLTFDTQIELTKDAKFSIMMLDLMGGKKIEISNGVSSERMNFDEIQNGKFAGDVSTAMAALGSVQDELVSIIKDVKVSLDNINEVLSDEELKTNIKSTIIDTKQLLQKINLLITDNREKIGNLLEKGNTLLTNSNNFIYKNENEIKQSIESLNKLLKNSDSLIVSLNKITNETIDKKNNIGKLMYDDNTYNKLFDTLEKINILIDELNNQLKGKGLNVDLF
ncbi:MAG TPA: MlaD family protein [Melioribacteraceae bacterium]|nr:MlaD family protein [Melioribacteraceae bacterium]